MADDSSLRRGQRTRAKPSWMEEPVSICSQTKSASKAAGTQGSTLGSMQKERPAYGRSMQRRPKTAAKPVPPLAKMGAPRKQINGRLLATGECWSCHLEKTIRAGAVRPTRPKEAHVRCSQLTCSASLRGFARDHMRTCLVRFAREVVRATYASCLNRSFSGWRRSPLRTAYGA